MYFKKEAEIVASIWELTIPSERYKLYESKEPNKNSANKERTECELLLFEAILLETFHWKKGYLYLEHR